MSVLCSLIRKAYMELALVCFASCQLIQLTWYGSLLPQAITDSSILVKGKVSMRKLSITVTYYATSSSEPFNVYVNVYSNSSHFAVY